MFYIEHDAIYITKGDDAVLEISNIDTQNGEPYELQDDDVLTLTVRQMPTSLMPILIQVNNVAGDKCIVINHEHTENLNVGLYSADIQLTTGDGNRYTIWPQLKGDSRFKTQNFNNFVVMPEVTTT